MEERKVRPSENNCRPFLVPASWLSCMEISSQLPHYHEGLSTRSASDTQIVVLVVKSILNVYHGFVAVHQTKFLPVLTWTNCQTQQLTGSCSFTQPPSTYEQVGDTFTNRA
jgi:hypothetical protein